MPRWWFYQAQWNWWKVNLWRKVCRRELQAKTYWSGHTLNGQCGAEYKWQSVLFVYGKNTLARFKACCLWTCFRRYYRLSLIMILTILFKEWKSYDWWKKTVQRAVQRNTWSSSKTVASLRRYYVETTRDFQLPELWTSLWSIIFPLLFFHSELFTTTTLIRINWLTIKLIFMCVLFWRLTSNRN